MIDADFIKNDKVSMTKEEIRYIAIGYLEINRKKEFLNIGSATGTMSLEALMQNQEIQVTSVEVDQRGYLTTLMNIEAFEQKYGNIKKRINLINDLAPCDLDGKFDCVYIGGSKGRICELLEWSYKIMRKDATLVLTFRAMEKLQEAVAEIRKNEGFAKPRVSQIAVAEIEKLGKYSYIQPDMPVCIIKTKKL